MAEGVNVANAFVTIMPSMQGAQSAITEAILPAASETGEEAGTTLGSMLTGRLGKAVSAFAAGFTVEKVFGGLMQVGESFEDLKNSIVRNTGASGAALDDMENSARQVYENVPISLDAAGTIVESLTQRMGLSGDTLTGVAEKIAAVQKMTGTAVDMSTLTGAFNLFGVAAQNTSGEMDTLYAVTQNTGIGFNDLVSTLQMSGPAMNELGFSMDDTAEMAGALSKAGLDANSTLSRMARALPELSQNGESAGDTFNRVKTQMQDYISQGNDSAALEIANNLFGTRGATQFLAAVKSGAMNIEDLGSLAQSASGNIMETAAATSTWQGKMQIMENRLSESLEPLAGGLLDGITDSFKDISGAISSIDPSTMQQLGADLGGAVKDGLEIATNALKWMLANGPAVKAIIGGIAAGFTFNAAVSGISTTVGGIKSIATAAVGSAEKVASFGNTISLFVNAAEGSGAAASGLVMKFEKFGPAIAGAADKLGSIGGILKSGLVTAFSSVAGAASKLFAIFAANPIILVVAAVALLVAGLVYFFTQTETGKQIWADFTTWLGGAIQTLGGVFTSVGAAIVSGVQTVGAFFTGVWQGACAAFQVVWGVITAFVATEIAGWRAIFQAIGDFFGNIWQGASIVFQAIWNLITGFISTEISGWQIIFQTVGDFFTAVWQGASGAVSGIVSGITGFFSAAGSDVQSIWQGVVDWFSGVPGAIGGFFGGIADLLSAPFRAAFDSIRGFWNSTIGGFGFTVPDWIPAIGGQSFAIPYLASGGIVDSAQLAMIGEAGPEVVMPLSKIQPIISAAMVEGDSSGSSFGGDTVNVYIDGIKYNTDSYIDSSVNNFVDAIVARGEMYSG